MYQVTPKTVTGPVASGSMIPSPSTIRNRPGIRKRKVELWRSMKRRCLQPSRQVLSFDSPIRGWYSIGISPTLSFRFEALRIISDANSMPVAWRSSLGTAERRIARIPQWASETRTP
jgi:hypothetical protein